ncbi:DUF4150 domain-containing protein [Chondromyces crocatus]|uniref:Tox-PAAR-like domain-containing protein n=1 Tax=Chondromyces crocatus TaxID=52 RepID=A0A0K1E634_CHOCO|nr:DUF4150 domain-containing protein [Chondromyces crocatus]AKT36335.1 uncharacterized protein CMC5_004490 [Chondromyces crocatus]
MPVKVNVNGLSLCHKGSDGITIATAPDVCVTPPGVPIPYPNVAYSSDLAQGTTTVFADGGNSIAHRPSIFAKSTGDEPGTMGGVKSGTFTKEASWLTFSADVKFEGEAACRLTDKMLHNHGNTFNCGGEMQAPVKGDDLDCQAMWDEVNREVEDVLSHGGDADPITRNRHITAAYARVYRAHPELKWAGMGAFVSKEAGCGMKEAKGIKDGLGGYDPRASTANTVFKGLADGNKAIFRDIYPQFLFYAKYGNDAFQRCADANGVTEEMKEAFDLFAKGGQENIEKATMLVATQEQRGTLETMMQSNKPFRDALDLNKTTHDWWVGRPFGAKSPDVFMSSACGGGPRIPFEGSITNTRDRLDMAKRVSLSFDQVQSRWPEYMSDQMAIMQHGTILTAPGRVGPPAGTVLPLK